jgi:hemerythrin
MERFIWSAEHEIFLAPVDAEHRDLFRIADELSMAVMQGVSPEAVCDHLHGLAASMLVETGDADAARLLLHFLAGWLRDHTTLTDRMMAAFVRNHERAHLATSLDRHDKAVGASGEQQVIAQTGHSLRHRPPSS